MRPEILSPHAWLEHQPLQPSEQLFAIFSSASAAEPLAAWQRLAASIKPSPIWADTAYAEWEEVMPFVGVVAVDSEFLSWVASTAPRDWGWLAVSSASQQVLVEHLRSLTQVFLPNGSRVFFRFWDGRYLLPMLQCGEVEGAHLLPAIARCLINGQSLEIGGGVQETSKVFPWWEVPETLLRQLGDEDPSTQIGNLMQWLSEEQSGVFEAFPERVLRSKVANFLEESDLPLAPKDELLAYLMEEVQ
ncbi:DUF4123 domain-containing protein [Pseudomonas baetica]|uniref:DUF4123 domain-containing protein n=1 Tax=Pseudomonas baetica TaxID=674054 RepID=UPI003EEEA09E